MYKPAPASFSWTLATGYGNCFSGPARDSVRVTIALRIRLTFPLSDEQPGPSIPLRRWWPTEDESRIVVPEKQFSMRFWIDDSCRHSHIHENLAKVHCEIDGISVPESLGEFVLAISEHHNWTVEGLSVYSTELLAEYNRLGQLVYRPALDRFNRLVSYIRAEKGVFWIHEYQPEETVCSSALLKLRAKVKVGNSDWVRFTSTATYFYRLHGAPEGSSVTDEDWPRIADHVRGQRPATLVGQLLAGADEFCNIGHSRAAITEAVSALEVAIVRFSQEVDLKQWRVQIKDRTAAESFHSHVQHLGTTCTVSYLLPLLYDETQIPKAVLDDCRSAIEIRNAVVHRGQRDIDEANLRRYLFAIRQLCQTLKRLQIERAIGEGVE
jgi:hypothetical protein